MNSLIETIYRTGYTEDEHGQPIYLFPTSIPYEEGVALYQLIRRVKPARTIEIGMAYGLSSLFICQALEDNGNGSHLAIDPYERTRWKSIGLLNLQRAGLAARSQLREATSHEALPTLLAQGEHFDLAFVDGFHRFDYTILEFFYLDAMLRPGGLIVFDDLSLPAIRKALTFILRNRNYRLAPELIETALPTRDHARRLFYYLKQAPLDLLPALVFFAQPRFCVMRKIADDDKPWDFYRSF